MGLFFCLYFCGMAEFKILKDNDLMPYGQHKGKPMKEVPAKDLLWLSDNDRCSPSVRAYITDNWEVLCKQAGRKPKLPYASMQIVQRRNFR